MPNIQATNTAPQTSVQAAPPPPAGQPARPAGISAQPTTITPPAESNVLLKVGEYLDDFGEFIHRLVVKALEELRSFLGSMISVISGSAGQGAPPSTEWQLPPETQNAPAPAATPPAVAAPLPPQAAPQPVADSLSDLLIRPNEQKTIYDIIHTAATSNPGALALYAGWFERAGKEILHVHPYRFVEYIFKHPTLIADMKSMRDARIITIPWTRTVGGIAEGMRREYNTLPQYLNGFARSLNVNPAELLPFIQNKDWLGLTNFLLDVKLGLRQSVFPQANPPQPPPLQAAPPHPPQAVPAAVPVPVPVPEPAAVIPAAPPAPAQMQNLRHGDADKEIVFRLFVRYSQDTRYSLWRNGNELAQIWSQLDAVHPLKLLHYISSTPELMAQLNTIFSYYGTKAMFMSALNIHMAKTPYAEISPYIQEFSDLCGLNRLLISANIQNGRWNAVVEEIWRKRFVPVVA